MIAAGRAQRRARLAAQGLAALGLAVFGLPGVVWRPAQAAETAVPTATASVSPASLTECHVTGIRNSVLCGSLQRPLDPAAAPAGAQITIRYVVVPAMARRKLADPVFMLAGGPGQSAVGVAALTLPIFARLNNRRDIVFVDQRGTGGSAQLECPESGLESASELADVDRQVRFIAACKAQLLKLPYIRSAADLGLFTTWIAVQDLDAVRRALGAERVDLVGGSYGTRAALEYLRQFPQAVRRTVLDGVAPPDMILPASFSTDNQSALDSLLAACAAEAKCARAHPGLAGRLAALLQGLPRKVTSIQPATGKSEEFVLTRDLVLGSLRSSLYVPALAAALPQVIDDAAGGDYAGLVGMGSLFAPRKATRLAAGMHLSVVCAEDVPRLQAASDAPGATFGDQFARFYERLCREWPRGSVPAAFYTVPASASPVLLLSGGLDPATPPRHAERVQRALGPLARSVVIANAGHGTMAIGCMRDVVFRFIDAADDRAAAAVDAGCAARLPRPGAFQPVVPAAPAATELAR